MCFKFLNSYSPNTASISITNDAFDTAVKFTKLEEGGWYAGNMPGDPNPTNFGIIQRTYDAYRTNKGLPLQSVKDISPQEVSDIYAKYWKNAQCDEIASISREVAICHFDTAFNAGWNRSALILQKTVGATQDGQIGPMTLLALRNAVSADESMVVFNYIQNRYDFLRSLSNWSNWGKGWTIRLEHLSIVVGSTWKPQ